MMIFFVRHGCFLCKRILLTLHSIPCYVGFYSPLVSMISVFGLPFDIFILVYHPYLYWSQLPFYTIPTYITLTEAPASIYRYSQSWYFNTGIWSTTNPSWWGIRWTNFIWFIIIFPIFTQETWKYKGSLSSIYFLLAIL